MKTAQCPCCGCTLVEEELANGFGWDVYHIDLKHYQNFGEVKAKLYTVCDSCFCDFGDEILPYDDMDVRELEEFSWLREKPMENFWKNEAECSYFMTEIPLKNF